MPIRLPAVGAWSQGMPISQHTGAISQPSMRCNDSGAPAKSGSSPRMALARCTSATSTISMAQMVSSSSRPATVPLTMASMVLDATGSGSTRSPPVPSRSAVSGTMIRLIRIAAGAPKHRGDHQMRGGVRDHGPSMVA